MQTSSFEEIIEKEGFLFYRTMGKSMYPLIRQGKDCVLIKKPSEGDLKKYAVALFIRPGGPEGKKYVLHRILKVGEDETYWIVGDNYYSGEWVKKENIIGILSSVSRKDKTLDVSDFTYQVYTHLWCDLYPLRFAILRSYARLRGTAGKMLRAMHLR